MRWAIVLVFLLLPLCLCLAQLEPAVETPAAQAEDPLQLVEDARVLYVARELKLRADQVQKITPLLNQAQGRIKLRDQTLDGLWVKGQAAIVAVDQALAANREPDRAAQNAVEKLIADHAQACQSADADLEKIAGQILGLLDKQQAARVENVNLQQGPQQDDAGELVDYVAGYATAMRQLLPEEYDTLRVPVALRLAGELLAPDQPGYNNAVGNVLRLIDGVRRLSDAEFAQNQPQLGQVIARALGLPEGRAPETYQVSFADLMAFVSSPRTAPLLVDFKPEPAMEVVP